MQCPNFNQLQTIKLLTVAFIVKQLSVKCQRTSLRYPFRYRGYYYDVETGFYYLQSRYYDPEIRRFINADNLELLPELAQVPGQLNLYAYCNNNPIMYTDPSGELFISLGAVIFGSSILALLGVGAAIEVKYHPIQNSIENIADAISDLVYDVQDLIKIDSIDNISQTNIINNIEILESRERNRGRDSGLSGYSNDELVEELNKAKQAGDSLTIQRILREMKIRGMRNKRKNRNNPHRHGYIFFILANKYVRKRLINES